MTFPIELCIVFGVAVLFSSVGLYRFIWFTSVGYGLSVAGAGGILLLLFHARAETVTLVCCAVMLFFGCRLAAFLLHRDLSPGSWRKKEGEQAGPDSTAMGVRLMCWFGCAVLYAMMASPLVYRLVSGQAPDGWVTAGAVLMGLGAVLETAADASKSRQKKKYPGEVCRRGLYHFVRCPNYLGEILFWTGVLIAGITVFVSPGQWIIAGLGYLGILFVMFSAARRLEERQDRVYGQDPRYQRYVKRVPILLPFIPLRSLRNWKFLAH